VLLLVSPNGPPVHVAGLSGPPKNRECGEPEQPPVGQTHADGLTEGDLILAAIAWMIHRASAAL
jgi:hypothetical protein